jgi:hypothetical protein
MKKQRRSILEPLFLLFLQSNNAHYCGRVLSKWKYRVCFVGGENFLFASAEMSSPKLLMKHMLPFDSVFFLQPRAITF